MYLAKEIASNDYVHQAFSAYADPKKIARLMLDGEDLKPFYKFCRDAEPLLGDFDRDSLEEEYAFAVRRAHLANDVKEFRRERKYLPNMRWEPSLRPGGCKRHERFFNRVWAINDPFWKENMPCDNIDCECSLSSTDDPVTR